MRNLLRGRIRPSTASLIMIFLATLAAYVLVRPLPAHLANTGGAPGTPATPGSPSATRTRGSTLAPTTATPGPTPVPSGHPASPSPAGGSRATPSPVVPPSTGTG